MPERFDAGEILKIAVQVKESSCNLYEAIKDKGKDQNLKNLWAYLKEESQVHAKVFKEMVADLEDYIVYQLISEEYNQYLRELTPSYEHAQKLIEKKTKELFDSDLEAVEFGIYIAIESILAYSTLKEHIIPEKLDLLNTIIGDEKRSLARLSAFKKQLKRQNKPS